MVKFLFEILSITCEIWKMFQVNECHTTTQEQHSVLLKNTFRIIQVSTFYVFKSTSIN